MARDVFAKLSREQRANVKRFKATLRARIQRQLKRHCPFDTGVLRRSIRVVKEGRAFRLEMVYYGRILHFQRGNKHRGWIDRIIRRIK